MANVIYPDYEYEEDPDETEYAEYYDDYDYANLGVDGDEEIEWVDNDAGDLESLTSSDVLEYCVWPTLASTAPHIFTLLAGVLVFTLSTRTVPIPGFARHVLSCASGGTVLWQVFGSKTTYLAGQVVTGCLSIALAILLVRAKLLMSHSGAWLVTCCCVSYLLVCELWLVDAAVWHSVRGAQMIILMKLISYAHDILPNSAPASSKLKDEIHEKQDGHTKDEQTINAETIKKTVQKFTPLRSAKKNKSMTETSGEQRIPNRETQTAVRMRRDKTECITSAQSGTNVMSNSLPTNCNEETSSRSVKNKAVGNSSLIIRVAYAWAELCGYLLHPGTVVFGPWCSVSTYRQILEPLTWSTWWGVGVALNLAVSGSCLLGSTCVVTWLIPDYAGRWLVAYREALSFRLSHYFVSHLSEASAQLGGLEVGVVARGQHVEMPRSLISVVTYWNIPMHTFLKKYVFERVRSVVGVWGGVLCTYSASALIHGLNGQLCAVLISLAVYTHAEHCLRVKLAKAFDACVLAKPCRKPCIKHTNTDKSLSSIVINVLLGCVCAWHLAYLGVMFDSAPNSASGYSISHTLSKWAALQFASHWVVVATYGIMLLI